MTTPHLAEPSGRPLSPWPRDPSEGRPDAGSAAVAAMLESLIGQASVGVAFYDSHGRYVRVNEIFARLGGHPAADHVGRTMSELWGDVGREMERLVRRVLATGEPITDVEVSFATGGPERPQTWTVSWFPVTDPRLGTVGAASVATDVTARKDAEVELGRTEALYRSLSGVSTLDVVHAGPDGNLDVDLPALRALTGQSRDDLGGLGWLGAVHPAERERVTAAWRTAIGSGQPFEAEYRVVAQDRSERVVATRVLPVADDSEIAEWVGISRDVTEARYGESARTALAARAQAAADHAERMAELVSALARAVSVDDVVAVVLDAGVRVFGAAGRGVAVVDETRDRLRFRALAGYPEQVAARWSEIGLGAVNPAAETVRGGRPIFLSGRDELTARWPVPELAADVAAGDEHAWAVLPLVTTAAPFGVLALGFTEARMFGESERAQLGALADQCAQALERAGLVEQVLAEAAAGQRAAEGSRSAVAAAREAQQRLDLLVRASRAVAAAIEPDDALRALSEVVVSELADSCAVYLVEPDELADGDATADVGPAIGFGDHPLDTAVADEERTDLDDTMTAAPANEFVEYPGERIEDDLGSHDLGSHDLGPHDLGPADLSPDDVASDGSAEDPLPARPVVGPVLRRVVAVARPGLTDVPLPRARVGRWPADSPVNLAAITARGSIGPVDGAPWLSSSEIERWMRHVGAHTMAAVPIVRRGQVAGVVSFTAAGDRAPYTAADLTFFEEVAARAAAAVEHADLDRRGRDTALGLQHTLLPATVVGIDGIDVAARYVPGLGGGVSGGDVGGDWFDAIDLGAGRIALVIGDASGHGTRAALLMGQLRTAARVCARVGMSPREVLSQLGDLVTEIAAGQAVTCAYAVVEPAAGLLTLASAGHPPPLFVAADGLVSRPYMEVGAPLGVGGGDVREYTVRLGAGSGIALFTDGLVRSGDGGLDAGVSGLAAVLAEQEGPAQWRVDDALAALGRADGHDDDVVLLIARLSGDA